MQEMESSYFVVGAVMLLSSCGLLRSFISFSTRKIPGENVFRSQFLPHFKIEIPKVSSEARFSVSFAENLQSLLWSLSQKAELQQETFTNSRNHLAAFSALLQSV